MRISDPVYRKPVLSHRGRGANQKVLQFARPLFVAPIADPDNVGVLLGSLREETSGVGGLVKGPGFLHAETF